MRAPARSWASGTPSRLPTGAGPGRPGGGGGNGGGDCTPEVGTGQSLTEGDVALDTVKCGDFYQLTDMTRGGGSTHNMGSRKVGNGSVFVDADNSWGSGGLTDSATVAADAHYGISETWDYYFNIHGREGIDGNGTGALTRVHYGRNYANAFWSDGRSACPLATATMASASCHWSRWTLWARNVARCDQSYGGFVYRRSGAPTKPPPTSWARWSSSTPTTPMTRAISWWRTLSR